MYIYIYTSLCVLKVKCQILLEHRSQIQLSSIISFVIYCSIKFIINQSIFEKSRYLVEFDYITFIYILIRFPFFSSSVGYLYVRPHLVTSLYILIRLSLCVSSLGYLYVCPHYVYFQCVLIRLLLCTSSLGYLSVRPQQVTSMCVLIWLLLCT